MAYGIWLSWNNQQEGFQIPVNPSSIEMSDGSKGQTYDVAGLGEINVIKNPKLTTYQFSSIFPARKYPFADGPALMPVLVNSRGELDEEHGIKTNPYVWYLTKWMASKRPIRFVFTGDTFDINVAASIDTFDWKEIAGSGGDIEYTLTLKKYVFYAAQRIVFNTKNGSSDKKTIAKASPRPNDKQPPKTYTLRSGDTLWKVAKSQLGNGDRWREIQKLNGISDAQLKKLSAGKILKLPS